MNPQGLRDGIIQLEVGKSRARDSASDICGYSTSMGWAVLAEQHIILELDGGVRDVFVKLGLYYAHNVRRIY